MRSGCGAWCLGMVCHPVAAVPEPVPICADGLDTWTGGQARWRVGGLSDGQSMQTDAREWCIRGARLTHVLSDTHAQALA